MARALSALRGASQHGASAAVLVSGPAGIGKTALLAEICHQAVPLRFRVAASKCDQVGQVWPAAPVIALLRAGPNPLAGAADYEQVTRSIAEPLILADRIASQLEQAAAAGPLLIAVDDLHWADQVSLFTLRTAISRLIGLPAVWLLASRDGGVFGELDGHERVRTEQIRLTPLSGTDITALAMDRLGRVPDERARRFLDTADGNPFLAGQIIDGLAQSAASGDQVPAEFTGAVARRVAALTEPARRVVHLTAVAGRPFPVRDLAGLIGGDAGLEQAVADAVESGLILASSGSLTFHHDLVRDAASSTVPTAAATGLHRALARYYLAGGDPLVAAWHARAAAGPGDLAAANILLAAAEMLVPVSADDAGELAALAFQTIRPVRAGWLALSLRCLSVLSRAQRPAEAMAVAEDILARSDDSEVIGKVETEAAQALWLGGRIGELIARTERALKLADLDAATTARLRGARALAGTRVEDGDCAAREAAAALAYARTTGDRAAVAVALQASGEAARNQARHRDALRHFRELRSLSDVSCLAEEVMALQFLDRYEHAQTLLDQARADSCGMPQVALPSVACAQMWQDFNLGRLDDADAQARAIIELGQRLGNGIHAMDAVIIRVSVALFHGEIEHAAAFLNQADGLIGIDDEVRRPGLAVMQGWVAATRGDLDAAVRSFRPVAAGAGPSRAYWPLWPCWNGLFFQVGAQAGDHEFTGACLDVAETAAVRNPGVASFEGVALNIRGRSSEDLATTARSAEVLARSPRPILRAFGADSYGRVLLTAGQRSAALAQLDLAWDEYHRIGAWAWRADTQRVMREAGARRAKWSATTEASTGWAALTPAERRVALLIGTGHTNKSAATDLGVSVNTVATHLRSVFTKLNIQSRVQLANELHKANLT
jgi:DNA-binding CsgD family transcriptional regulator